MDPTGTDALGAGLFGRRLLSVEKLDHTWRFRFDGCVTVTTEAHWRLTDGESIHVSSEDHGQRFGLPGPVDAAARAFSALAGRCVEVASVSASTGDLLVGFGGGARLEFLQLSSGYEAWRLSAPSVEVVCLGGGRIARVP